MCAPRDGREPHAWIMVATPPATANFNASRRLIILGICNLSVVRPGAVNCGLQVKQTYSDDGTYFLCSNSRHQRMHIACAKAGLLVGKLLGTDAPVSNLNCNTITVRSSWGSAPFKCASTARMSFNAISLDEAVELLRTASRSTASSIMRPSTSEASVIPSVAATKTSPGAKRTLRC